MMNAMYVKCSLQNMYNMLKLYNAASFSREVVL